MGTRSKNLNDSEKDYLRSGILISGKYYAEHLINRRFLVITDDYDMNIICFLKEDFLHLTGLKVNISEDMFFKMCTDGTIAKSNINTSQKYNYKTLRTKNQIIRKIDKFLCPDSNCNLFLRNVITDKTTFPVAISNDDENMTIAFREDDNHARSIRKSSQTKNYSSSKLIIAVFEMKEEENVIQKLIYKNGFDIEKSKITEAYSLSEDVQNILIKNLTIA